MLKRIQCKGFKSIREMDLELGRINVLIGSNGAGKSNLVSLFDLLRRVYTEDFETYIAVKGGAETFLHFGAKTTQQMEIGVEFDEGAAATVNHYTFAMNVHDNLIGVTAGEGDTPVDAPFADIGVFHFDDTSELAKIRAGCDIDDNYQLAGDARNLAAFLHMLQHKYPKQFRLITHTVRRILPGFQEFLLKPRRLDENKIRLKWRETASTDYTFAPHQLSDGMLRFIAFAALLLQPPGCLPKLVVVDEPELGLHPAAINLLGAMIRSASHKSQIVLATQSLNLVDQFVPEELIVVERQDGGSEFKRFEDPEELSGWLEEYALSELWEKNILGGRP